MDTPSQPRTPKSARAGRKPDTAADERPSPPWFQSTWALALAGGLLLWAAFPPLNLWPLAWVAPLSWLALIRQPRLFGRRPYLVLWLAGFLHWLVMLQGIRLAHPALYLGWLALAAYVGCYPVLFIALSRVAVHRLGVSPVLATPVVWVGLELARGHALTGFSMALLGHTQLAWTTLIQISDLGGAYGVSFLVMLGAAGLGESWARMAARPDAAARRRRLLPLLPAVGLLAAALGYGYYRTHEADSAATPVTKLRVALIQASFDTVFEADRERAVQIFRRYRELSLEAVRGPTEVDLVVWPEGTFTGDLADVLVNGEPSPPPDVPLSAAEYQQRLGNWAQDAAAKAAHTARLLNAAQTKKRPGRGVSLLVGTDTLQAQTQDMNRYNSALLIDPAGEVTRRYFKSHLVMFGEYIPWGDVCPWLYRLTPMPSGLSRGTQFEVFEVAGVRLAPSICFESTVPHLMRRQVAELERAGLTPDVLVNVTNDGWFWGSAMLDYHLACAAFRAVELRRPMLVAANTGLSAQIDDHGRILEQGPRRGEQIILADVHCGRRGSLYKLLGDIPAGLCLAGCVLLAIVGRTRSKLLANPAERVG